MSLLEGRTGLIFGIANDRSIAWHIAKNAIDQGATCGFTHLPGEKMAARVSKAISGLGLENPWLVPCDASSDQDLDKLFAAVKAEYGSIDFIAAGRPPRRSVAERRRTREIAGTASGMSPGGGEIARAAGMLRAGEAPGRRREVARSR